jgi:hypothetical protein
MKTLFAIAVAVLVLVPADVFAQATNSGAAAQPAPPPRPLSRAAQIEAAVAPLPEQFRATATVLGYQPGATTLVPLRPTDGAYICLATDPGSDRFHVACYHRSLEPFMARGRELRAQGVTEVDPIRNADVEARRIRMPEQAAALYSLTGTWAHVTDAGVVSGAQPLYVIYVPFATAESTGIPTRAAAGMPWLMNPGTAKAHIMFVPTM